MLPRRPTAAGATAHSCTVAGDGTKAVGEVEGWRSRQNGESWCLQLSQPKSSQHTGCFSEGCSCQSLLPPLMQLDTLPPPPPTVRVRRAWLGTRGSPIVDGTGSYRDQRSRFCTSVAAAVNHMRNKLRVKHIGADPVNMMRRTNAWARVPSAPLRKHKQVFSRRAQALCVALTSMVSTSG